MADLRDFYQVNEYVTSLVPERNFEMKAMEVFADETGFPIIGPASGYLCYQVTRMIKAHTIFEMGSGYGYSTAWFARAVVENRGGTVHHVVWDAELSQHARQSLGKLGFSGVIDYHVGEAIEILQDLPGQFDLIFNDIDKECYPESLQIIREKLRPGGVLIVDNMLWGGRIFDPAEHEASTEGVRELTRLLTHDPAWITTMIPIRDGMLVAYRNC
jgi:predicted O-methyltransferase YrrM